MFILVCCWMTWLSNFICRLLLFRKAYALPAKACSDIDLFILYYFHLGLLYVRLGYVLALSLRCSFNITRKRAICTPGSVCYF